MAAISTDEGVHPTRSGSHSAEYRPRVRLTLQITDELNDRLADLAAETAGSKSDLLRKAIALVEVAVEARRAGNQLAVVDRDQRVVSTVVGL